MKKKQAHPNSLANLKRNGRTADYGTQKHPVSIGLTQDAKSNLVQLAESQQLSLSEFLERLGRRLSPEKLDSLFKEIPSPARAGE